jgi:hypothetical protein
MSSGFKKAQPRWVFFVKAKNENSPEKVFYQRTYKQPGDLFVHRVFMFEHGD